MSLASGVVGGDPSMEFGYEWRLRRTEKQKNTYVKMSSLNVSFHIFDHVIDECLNLATDSAGGGDNLGIMA
jgi:hypothetical protein